MKLDPQIVETFRQGLIDAEAGGVLEPTAMILSTRHENGDGVSSRTVLLKQIDEDGLMFFTNSESNKGRQLQRYPHAALVFLWRQIERQVVIEGQVQTVTAEEADQYFASRPRGSQIGAWASQQSRPLASRQVLESRVREVEEEYADQQIPRPPYWMGYRLAPTMVEFWYGRPYRLHDRHRWTLEDGAWRETRLFP
ncbi:MAG: pyridoxamine 5'-phosphate oxidase [Wenzhouxiangellaceae bacterium]